MKEIFRGKNLKKNLPLRGAQAMMLAGSLLLGSSCEGEAKDNANSNNSEIFLPMIVYDDTRSSIEEFSLESETQILTEAFEMQKEIEYALLNPPPAPTEIPPTPVLAPSSGPQVSAAEVYQGTQNSGKIATSGDNLWLVLADCETGDSVIGAPFYAQWDYNGPSGFDGAMQYLPSTWASRNTDYEFAWQAPPEVQIEETKELISESSWRQQFPECTAKMINAGYKEQMEAAGRIE